MSISAVPILSNARARCDRSPEGGRTTILSLIAGPTRGVQATSKRNRPHREAAVLTGPSPQPWTTPSSDLFRQVLLALTVMLLVSRPFLGGESPGFVSDFSNPSALSWTLLLLLTCTGWAGWRLWKRPQPLYLGMVDYALIALALLVFYGAAHASYRRISWLAGWDWLGVVLLALLVRQLSVRPEERQGLVAAFLACAVALAAEGAFQAAYELPRQAAAAKQKEGFDVYIAEQIVQRGMEATTLEADQLQDRLVNRRPVGPYFHPSSLAAALTLALPALLGAVIACFRSAASTWMCVLSVLVFLLVAAVLGLTGVWMAAAALGVVVLGVLGLFWPRSMGGWKVGLSLALLAGLGTYGWLAYSLERCREVWPAAWKLVQANFLLGLGPAQFSIFYPRYMAESAGHRVADPSNALLEVWSDAGVFGVVVLIGLVVLLGRAVWTWFAENARLARIPEKAAPAPGGAEGPPAEPPFPWEFYAGGMTGLVFAFVLRASWLPQDDVISEALAAGLRAIAWFAAYSLFESVAWSGDEQAGALTAGVAAVLLLFLVQGGIGYPSVAGLVWVAVALILTTVAPQPAEWLSRRNALEVLSVPVFLGTAFAFLAFILYPTANSDAALRRTRLAGMRFKADMSEDPNKLRDPVGFVKNSILAPLQQCIRDDPENVKLLVMLATWNGQLWALAPQEGRYGAQGFEYAGRARMVNPEGREGYWTEFERRLGAAQLFDLGARSLEDPKGRRPASEEETRKREAGRLHQAARQECLVAADVLGAYEKKDPTNPGVKYMRASALFAAGKVIAGRKEAEMARKLDERVGPPRNLSDQQRSQIEKWLGQESSR